MLRLLSGALLGSLLIGALAHGENASGSPQLRIFLPPNDSRGQVEIHYILYGAFGAFGNSVDASVEASSVEVPLAVRGQVAEEIKAFAWMPGCRIETFDLRVENVDLQSSYSCAPLPPVLLIGRVRKSDLPRSKETEIHVGYFPSWTCEFFESADCTVFEVSIATAKIDSTGHFEIELPDFASDSVGSNSRDPGLFQVTLRDVGTGNIVASLSPESEVLRALGDKLKPALVYPNPTMFVGHKPQ